VSGTRETTSRSARPDVRALRVLAHPLRLRLLSLLTARPLSGSEAARELGESQANVSYHLRRLHAAGLVSPVAEPGARGRTRRYRHDPSSGAHFSGGDADFPLLAAALAGELERRARRHRTGSPTAFTDAELWVDRRTWARAVDAIRVVGAELHEQALPAAAPGALRVSATIALFELDPRGGPAGPEPAREGAP
jgi:DNA-binding transcriptional ArsR family regulator